MDEQPVDDRPFLPGQLLFEWGSDTVEDAPVTEDTAEPSQSPPEADKSLTTATSTPPPASHSSQVSANQAVDETSSVSDVSPVKPRSKKIRRKTVAASPKKSARSRPKKKSSNAATRSRNPSASLELSSEKPATKRRPERSDHRSKPHGTDSIPTTTTQSPNLPPTSSKGSYHESMESISLKWGAKLPKVGFGFWKVDKDKTAEVCYSAIDVGYRHLDCACDYGNEEEVGQGIARAIKDGVCDREDLWVTSKLWNTYHAAEHVQQACEKSLQDLGLDYLDLYLIHFPIAQRFVPFEKRYPPGWFFDPDASNPCVEEARVPVSETWQAMEELAKSGLVRNIGVCNFGTSQLRDLLSWASIRPAVLQVETHPYLTQEKLLRYCNQEKIAYTAFSPLGAQSYFSLGMADPSEAVMQHATVQQIAIAVNKTPAQVLLRWGVQRGTAVIPKTSSRERMEENINLFDFKLTEDQMNAISALDQGRRFNDPGDFGEAAFNTFLPIYE